MLSEFVLIDQIYLRLIFGKDFAVETYSLLSCRKLVVVFCNVASCGTCRIVVVLLLAG